MRKHVTFFILANLFSIIAFTQATVISGNVKNSTTGDDVPAVSIVVQGSGSGTYTDAKGNFKLTTEVVPPLTLVISSIGYELKEVGITDAAASLNISLNPASTLGQEVVISATRTPSRILESPVTIERISAA
ncbi:MAG: carboxypeptidase-like regulatory domain-containing protein, partial [Ginsengibacter sp.]